MKKCTTEEQSVEVGIEWCTQQAKELKAKGVPSIHFYALNATQSVKQVAQNVNYSSFQSSQQQQAL